MKVTLNIHEYSTDKSFDFKIRPDGIIDWFIPYWDEPEGRRIFWNEFNAAIFDEIQKAAGTLKEGQLWRFTNNKDEIRLLKAGVLHPSINHADNTREAGLSVSQYAGYGAMGYQYCYRVTGNIIAFGSDGEPVLDIKSISPITRMIKTSTIGKRLDKNSAAAKAAWCKANDWTMEQLKIILDSCFPSRENMGVRVMKKA